MEIKHFKGLNYTPAIRLAYAANIEIMDAGLGEAVCNLNWSDHCIVAFDPDPIGIIIWQPEEHAKDIWLTLSYVVPEHRKCGVFTLMWNALIDKAREQKFQYIRSMTHVRNTRMREVARKIGRVEDGVRMTFTIPEVADAQS